MLTPLIQQHVGPACKMNCVQLLITLGAGEEGTMLARVAGEEKWLPAITESAIIGTLNTEVTFRLKGREQPEGWNDPMYR